MNLRAICLLLSFWLLAFSAHAQSQQALPLNPDVRHGVLPNGMHYYVMRNGKPENRVELRLAVQMGSIVETEEQLGLAHFVEHMAFNGSENFEKNDLVDYLESVGTRFGPDLNAYTSFDETVYMLQVATDKDSLLDKGLLVMQDWAGGATLDGEEIDKERGVVIEEWRLGQGAQQRILKQWLPKVLAGSRYAERLPIGTLDVLENFTHETMREFYRDWYRPDLMAIMVVGDIDPDEMEARIKKQFGALQRESRAPERPQFDIPGWEAPRVAIATDKEVRMPLVQLVYLHPEFVPKSKTDYRKALMHDLFGGMLNERLAEQTKQKDAPFIFGYSLFTDFIGPHSAYMSIAAVRNDGMEEGLRAIVRENERVRQHGFVQSELARQKIELMSQYEKAYRERNSTESSALIGELVKHYLKGEGTPGIAAEYALAKELLATITLEEVNALVNTFITDKNMAIIVNAPDKKGVEVPTEDALLEILKAVQAETLAPFEDKTSDEPLIAEKIKKGKLGKTEKLPQDIQRIQLGNGVTVLLKQTTFKKDQVLVRSRNNGGISHADDADYLSAMFADDIVSENGIGNFSELALKKYLAGKQVSVSPYLSELSHGIQGSCPPDQLETLFQLIYLYHTAPREDDAAFAAFIESQQAQLENKADDPMGVYGDFITARLFNNHPRRRPLNPEDIAQVKQAKALEAYRKAFSNARGTQLVIVGNFDVKAVRKLLAQYVASLPASAETPAWKDNNIQMVDAPLDVSVKKGIEPKSFVTMVFKEPFSYTRENNFELQGLIKVLEIKLRENLREERGGVYGVGTYHTTTHEPREEYLVYIQFGCNPDRVEELTEAVHDEIRALQQDGGQDKELQKVRETTRRGHETNLQENSWWRGRMATWQQMGYPFAEIAGDNLEAKLKTWTGEDVKAAAQKYLPLDKYRRLVLYPEVGGADPKAEN